MATASRFTFTGWETKSSKKVERYQPLPYGSQFRILERLARTNGRPNYLQARSAQISSSKPSLSDISYEAFSVGLEKPEHEIVFDGRPCFVRDNSWHLLRHNDPFVAPPVSMQF
jgi:hypothetical protein